MTDSPRSPHLAFIHPRLAQWLSAAPAAERQRLRRRVLRSHAAMRKLASALAPVQGIDAFCRPLFEEALARWFPGRPLPAVDQGWVVSGSSALSWLEAALQNFDPGAQIQLHAAQANQALFGAASASTDQDAHTFVSGVRNLDLGQRYREHLTDHIDTDTFRALLREQDRAAFAAELSQATLQGHLDSHGALLGETLYAGLGEAARATLQGGYLSLFGMPLNGPMLVRKKPARQVEPCLLYLPGHPRQALRQYPSLQAAGAALTELLRKHDERAFFLRYVSHAEQTRFMALLRDTLYPRYPYAQLHPQPPVLDKGDRFSWIERAFPAPTDVWQETLDLNARLELAFTPWAQDAFGERARVHVERRLQDAAVLAVPVAQRDGAALLARLEGWLGAGLSLLNVAGFFVPALGELLLVIGGAQIVDEFLDGVHAANEGDADAAIGHLFDVVDNLALFAALGAAGSFSEPTGALHQWQRLGSGDGQKLWPGELAPFARPQPWPENLAPGSDGLYPWQGQTWLKRDGLAMPLQRSADGSWQLAPGKGLRHQPRLLGNGQGTWLLDHERPLAWAADSLLQRLGAVAEGLDSTRLQLALRCSGYDAAALRRIALDHRPTPALLVDSLAAFGAQPPATMAVNPALDAVLARDFLSLTPRARAELIAHGSGQGLQHFERSGRLPLNMAESARLYLRESRINKALAQFHRAAEASDDRDTLAFACLPRLAGWSGELRIELRDAGLQGKLLAAAGDPGQPTKVLVRTHQGYRPYDELGQELAGHEDVFRALLQALPDSERDAMGLHIHQGPALRDQLFDLAAGDRRRCTLDLGMAQVRPQYRLPTRLPGERRIGYRLSGRGRGWLSEDELFDQLYPATPEGDREMLRQRLRHQAGPLDGAFARLLEQLQAQYRQLDTALQSWVLAPEGLAVGALEQQRALRGNFAQRVRSAWRRESAPGPHDNIDDINLVLDGHGLASLPVMPVQLAHVRVLNLNGLSTLNTDRLEGFLAAFPGVRQLDLAENALDRLPNALANMRELQALDFSENNIDIDTGNNLELLVGLTDLQRLNLSDAIQSLSVAALEGLAALPSLGWFQADLNELVMNTEHFQMLQRWPALRGLNLGQNAIVLDEPGRAALAGLNRLELLVLYENPLALAPDVTGWTQLQNLDLELTNISQWPQGLTELMNQQPLALRQLDLSANDLTEVPELRDSTYAQAVRAGQQDCICAFNGNPFTDQALTRLQEAGFGVPLLLPDAPTWSTDWPDELLAHIADTANDPQWQPLYDLMQRLPDTQDYQNAAARLRQRMQYVVQSLGRAPEAQANEGWGQAQVLQHINDLLNDAAQECVDQAILLFQQVETEVTVWQTVAHAAASDADEQVAVDSARALLRQRLLDERVGNLYQARVARRSALRAGDQAPAPALHADDDISDPILVSDHPDELEMALQARMRLRQRLQLPPQPQSMRFPQLAHLDDATLQRLGDAVEAGSGSAALTEWALDQPFWQAWVRRLRPEAFEALGERWGGASQYYDALSEASATGGAYTGPTVPRTYIQALERELGNVPGLAWRQNGVMQRIDLVSGRYPNEGALYQRAAELLLSSRQQDEAALLRELTEIMARTRYP